MQETKALTLILRNAAILERNDNVRYALRGAADTLEQAIMTFAHMPNEVNLIDVNGAWAYAVRVLKAHNEQPEPTPPTADQMRVAA